MVYGPLKIFCSALALVDPRPTSTNGIEEVSRESLGAMLCALHEKKELKQADVGVSKRLLMHIHSLIAI